MEDVAPENYWFTFLTTFSTFDIVVLAVSIIFIGFYFVSKKKTTEDTTSDSFTIIKSPSTLNRSASIQGGLIDKMQRGNKNVVVFYGSQTGTAEDFAMRLAKEAGRYGLRGMAADPEEVDMEEIMQLSSIEKSLAIFCMATYGEGDPTDNAQEMYNWLKDSNGVNLSGMRYAVFGLGNKTYENYNAMGKFVDKRLAELNAERICELGLGDDDGNIEENFLAWKEILWTSVCQKFGIDGDQIEVNMRQYRLETPENVPQEKLYKGEVTRLGSFNKQRPPFDSKNPFLSKVIVKRDLCQGSERQVIHMELDITGSRIKYDCGDHVAVFPTNDPVLVEKVGKLLTFNLDQIISLVAIEDDNPKRYPFPCPTTYRTALSHYVDITNPPKTNVLGEIAAFSSNPDDMKFLKYLASIDGKTKYQEWILDSRRSIIHVLEDLPSVKPPVDLLMEMLPRLHVRYYSISSSPKMHPESIHITVALVKYTSKAGREVKGVATNYLNHKDPYNNLQETPVVPIYVRRSQFRLPYKCKTSIIMVGPGTGLAPFRGFIQDRKLAKDSCKPIGETVLYFGCRKQSEDFLYEQEIRAAKNDGVLSDLYLAFSRDQSNKVYVQHLMNKPENRQQIWNIISQGGHFYICGDAKYMANDVNKTLLHIFETEGQMTNVEAQDYLKTMMNKGRHSSDVWS